MIFHFDTGTGIFEPNKVGSTSARSMLGKVPGFTVLTGPNWHPHDLSYHFTSENIEFAHNCRIRRRVLLFRNPTDRIVSLWKHAAARGKAPSFQRWLDELKPRGYRRPMVEYCPNPDAVICTESMANGIYALFGIHVEAEHLHKSPGPSPELSADNLDKMRSLYPADYEFWEEMKQSDDYERAMWNICRQNQCGEFDDGCRLMAVHQIGTPGEIKTHIRNGGGCLHPDPLFYPRGLGPPACGPYSRGSLDRHVVAVTALSRLPHHFTRQSICLDSWIHFGLTIYAVNTSEEIAELRPKYPQVDHWITSDNPATAYSWPTQRIHRLCWTAVELDRPIMLINSDIELYGPHERLTERLADDALVVGIRHNYPAPDYSLATREQWGLDAFVVTPKMARTLPDLGLAIGRPTWDYQMIYHFRELGFKMEFIGDPLFFHAKHDPHWSREDWEMSAKWINAHYGTDVMAYETSVAFRKSFPYPPE